jgi:hypothetical protein
VLVSGKLKVEITAERPDLNCSPPYTTRRRPQETVQVNKVARGPPWRIDNKCLGD